MRSTGNGGRVNTGQLDGNERTCVSALTAHSSPYSSGSLRSSLCHWKEVPETSAKLVAKNIYLQPQEDFELTCSRFFSENPLGQILIITKTYCMLGICSLGRVWGMGLKKPFPNPLLLSTFKSNGQIQGNEWQRKWKPSVHATKNILDTLTACCFLSGLDRTRVIHKLLPHRLEPCKKPCVPIMLVLLMEFNPNPSHTAVCSVALSYAHAPYWHQTRMGPV